jgi:hypothetical protein
MGFTREEERLYERRLERAEFDRDVTREQEDQARLNIEERALEQYLLDEQFAGSER